MKVIKKPLTELRRPDRNVRMHTDKQLKEFRRSVEMFGQIRPIVVDEDGVILAGNGLYETLLSLGRTEADCYVVYGLTEAEKKKLMLADNRVFDLGVDDLAALDASHRRASRLHHHRRLSPLDRGRRGAAAHHAQRQGAGGNRAA